MNRRCPHLGMKCSPSLQCIIFFEGASTVEGYLQVYPPSSLPACAALTLSIATQSRWGSFGIRLCQFYL